MLLNLIHTQMPACAFVLYDFKQISDAVLLITYCAEQQTSKTTMLNLVNGKWQPENTNTANDKGLLREINKKLSLVALHKNYLYQKNNSEINISDHHIFLLSGFCD